MKKTVYLLGAGFSKDAGVPGQAELIKNILALKSKSTKASKTKMFEWLEHFEKFLSENLCLDKTAADSTPLEDVFTPLDRCILDGISFRDVEVGRLESLREEFNNLIILGIREAISKHKGGRKYINEFAKYLVKKSEPRVRDIELDNVAVITTNWDTILDNELQIEINKTKKNPKDDFEGVVDYCCYISSLKENDKTIKPGLFALGRGKYNVKLLKLHGSMNWLQCPRCQRVFVVFNLKYNGGYVYKGHFCRHCKKNFSTVEGPDIKLRSNLVMPTFLKDLNNFQT